MILKTLYNWASNSILEIILDKEYGIDTRKREIKQHDVIQSTL